jgi:hypothetical protein
MLGADSVATAAEKRDFQQPIGGRGITSVGKQARQMNFEQASQTVGASNDLGALGFSHRVLVQGWY